jgi:two-component system, chemotaxis family, chemotaxis protein CheY
VNEVASDALMKLPEVLDLTAAEGFLESMRRQADGALCLDASDVRTITVPCVQIILAAARSREAMAIQNPSSVFLAAFDDLGIDWAQDFVVREGQPSSETSPEMGREPGEDDASGDDVEGAAQPPADGSELENSVSQINPHQMNESTMAKRILTIDDSKTMRDMLMLTLAEAGFDVLQAVDGQNGLDVLGDQHVDVIITDINMPIMDGYEVIRRLRQDPNHKSTPILVLTTESEAEKKNLARAAGATGWMVKPFDPDRLVATVRKVAP